MSEVRAERLAVHAAAAGVLFRDNHDRVLLVVPSYKNFLDLPGGFVERGEAPHQAAQREVKEELGICPPIGRLLVADWWSADLDQPVRSKLLLVFDGGVLDEANQEQIQVDGQEVVDYRFVNPSDLDEVTIPRLSNRIRMALSAVGAGEVAYLEDGINQSDDR